jgi:hypothetical protein
MRRGEAVFPPKKSSADKAALPDAAGGNRSPWKLSDFRGTMNEMGSI